MKPDQPPPLPRDGLPAALVRQRGFTWACAGVTAGFVSLNLAGVRLWTCPFLQLTGLPCPGCGLTRSCSCVLRGDFSQSVAFHAFGPLLMLIGLTGFAGSLLPDPQRLRFAGVLQHWDRRLRFSLILFSGLIAYSLTRWFFLR